MGFRVPLETMIDGLFLPLDLPDLWQQNAARMLASGKDVIIDAPTGAGKTRVFELFVEATPGARRGQMVFTVPTRALANDKFREWQTRGWSVGLATGDRAENVNAPVLVATLETQRERILSGNSPAMLVVDEYQMIADPKRGLNYELALALLPITTRVLLLSGSVRNPADIADWLRRLGREVEMVQVADRPVPLDDFPVEHLPRTPDSMSGFWPRLAMGAKLANLTPLLVFAPRRADAERIAKRISDGLPDQHPLLLPGNVDQKLGKDLAKMIRRRVAFHHSGLSYEARAGWVEPLAKNGHLDVIVATTGLAAGINFSVRSVFVADTRYQDGPYQREVRPDELLQMFGRAGRRGIDTRGSVLVAPQSPRLFDAAPRQLRRVNEIDWPTLLRVMEEAAAHGRLPLPAAASICTQLFSRQSIELGIESDSAPPQDAENASDPFEPTQEEFLDHSMNWRPVRESDIATARLADALTIHKDRWRPALRVASIADPISVGRLCKIPQPDGGFHYGKELALARISEGAMLLPHPWLRKHLRLDSDETFSEDEFGTAILPLLKDHFFPAKPVGIVTRGGEVSVRLSLADHRVQVRKDASGQALLDAPVRRAVIRRNTEYRTDNVGAENIRPRSGSAAYAWRKLGLVDDLGAPTPRGRVFSRFQNGEGLMIAAAIEDSRYPVDEIVIHLANIRGGHRFQELAGGPSDRLAFAARTAYGHVDYNGYLDAGLCPGYGDGTAEAISRFQSQGMAGFKSDAPDLRSGDIERAILEWCSLLRHIVHAPDAIAPGWLELQSAAALALEAQRGVVARFEPDLPAHLMQRAVPRPAARFPA